MFDSKCMDSFSDGLYTAGRLKDYFIGIIFVFLVIIPIFIAALNQNEASYTVKYAFNI